MVGNFLIRNCESFLREWEEGEKPLWTPIPSLAAHMDYQTADQVCQGIRAQGLHWVYVCDVYGVEADLDVIQRDGHRYSEAEIELMYQKAVGEGSRQ